MGAALWPGAGGVDALGGLSRGLDGGGSWEHVLYVNERTGANDVVIAPSNPDVVYCSTWHNHPGVSGPTSGVHRSDDGGRSWNSRNLKSIQKADIAGLDAGLGISIRNAIYSSP